MLTVKDLLLVGFFVSVGMAATPTAEAAGLAVLLLLLLPVKAVGFVLLMRAMGLRYRTSFLAGMALGNYSEFGLIVASVGVAAGLLAETWLTVIAFAVALGLVVAAIANRFGYEPVDRLAARLPERVERLHPDDRPIDIGHAQALVLGMGRVGRSTYEQLTEVYGLSVIGVEHDTARATALREAGFDVVLADATDADFWLRVNRGGDVRIAVLAMPFSTGRTWPRWRSCGGRASPDGSRPSRSTTTTHTSCANTARTSSSTSTAVPGRLWPTGRPRPRRHRRSEAGTVAAAREK